MPIKRKAPTKKAITLPESNLDDFKKNNGLSNISVKDKPLQWIPFSKDFQEETGLPGIPKGYVTIFKGFSDTGKSTSIYEAAVGCQKLGIIPVIIDTENAWSWEHARDIGMVFEDVVDEETGEVIDYKGFFIYINTNTLSTLYGMYDYVERKMFKDAKKMRYEACIEDCARYVDECLDKQRDGELNYELCFMWDSIGTLKSYKRITSDADNNAWDAQAVERSFMGIVNSRIPASKKEGQPFTNTFLAIQKIRKNIGASGGAASTDNKNGDAIYHAARLVFHMGGIAARGTTNISATSNGNTFFYGTQSRVKIEKNHINGLTWEGKLISTVHGYVSPERKDAYLKEYRAFFLEKLNVSGDAEIVLVEEAPSEDEIIESLVS
jgi:hypothetical protein